MDIYTIKENLVALEEIGCTLDTPERYIIPYTQDEVVDGVAQAHRPGQQRPATVLGQDTHHHPTILHRPRHRS